MNTFVFKTAPKLYHIILGRVKEFLITYFLCVFKKQHVFVVQSQHGQKSLTQTPENRNCNDLGFTLRNLYPIGSLQ